MVFQYFQHIYAVTTIAIYFCWKVISDNQRQVLTQLNKTNAFYWRPSIISKWKHLLLSTAKPPLPLYNVEICSVDTVTWLQHWKGEGHGNVNLKIEKLTSSTWRVWWRVFFRECLNCFCPWLQLPPEFLFFSQPNQSSEQNKANSNWKCLLHCTCKP